jgi:endonuclease YncB( thermonuclease family)
MRFLLVIFAAALAVAAKPAEKTILIPQGETASGRCVGVHDGDSMTVLIETPDGRRQAKIRLDGIDAPELGQAYSKKSKEALSALVFDKPCDVESLGGDKYGRTIGRVSVDGKDVGAAMLDAGMAWHFEKYDDRESMAACQKAAQNNKAGLWTDPEPIPPWEWRKMPKTERQRRGQATPAGAR